MHRPAFGGAPTSRVLPLGFCGQKPRWAPALVGWLLANAMRVRLCLRLCGCRRPAAKPRASSQQVFKIKKEIRKRAGSSACRYNIKKISRTRQCKASREQRLRAGKRANFSAAKNLPFCTSKTKEIHKIFKGDGKLSI